MSNILDAPVNQINDAIKAKLNVNKTNKNFSSQKTKSFVENRTNSNTKLPMLYVNSPNIQNESFMKNKRPGAFFSAKPSNNF